jgi:putative exosortase-associated protein (TIGR04073 family)
MSTGTWSLEFLREQALDMPELWWIRICISGREAFNLSTMQNSVACLSRRLLPLAVAACGAWVALGLFEQSGHGDIQDPPIHAHGPIRKLSRGLSNIAYAGTEFLNWIDLDNESLGNSATAGSLNGTWRMIARIGVGLYDVLTFPAPTWRGSYAPIDAGFYRSCIPWVNGGFEEYPPELGFETRLPYARIYSNTTRIP